MECPECHSTHIRKNGHRQQKQNYICVGCGRQFLAQYEARGYSDDVKQLCLKMYLNGMGIRGISRVTEISHVTILNWIKQSGAHVPECYDPKQIPHSEAGLIHVREEKFLAWAANGRNHD